MCASHAHSASSKGILSLVANHGEVLQLVHTDICGPIDPVSLGGNRYFLTVDFFQESTTFTNFKKPSNMQPTLRSDRGGESTSKVFPDCWRMHGN